MSERDRTLTERVEEFCSQDADPEDIRLFLARMLDTIISIRKQVYRGIVLMVALGGLFILLTAGGLSEVELLGVKVREFPLVLLVIPPIVDFLFLRCVMLQDSFLSYGDIYDVLMEKLFPRWSTSGLTVLVRSSAVSPLGFSGSISLHKTQKRITITLIRYFDVAILTLLPPLFTAYAYYVLISSSVAPILLTVVSGTIAIIFLIFGWLMITLMQSDE